MLQCSASSMLVAFIAAFSVAIFSRHGDKASMFCTSFQTKPKIFFRTEEKVLAFSISSRRRSIQNQKWRLASSSFADTEVSNDYGSATSIRKASSSSSEQASPRLIKAQRLLTEFQSVDSLDDIDDIIAAQQLSRAEEARFGNTENRASSTSSAQSSNKQLALKRASSTPTQTWWTDVSKASAASGAKSSASVIPPESFWANRNLSSDQGPLTTRWIKGMKVAEPLVKYDPVKAERLLFRQPTKWIVRNVQIALPLSLWAAGVVYDIVSGTEESNRRNRARQLLNTLTGLGPAIIKAGQALASRPDLMPSEYLEELQRLQDDVPRFSNELAFATVERELNITFQDVFELVEQEPIAAASIGQVYKARLRANGDLIALKIQRPKCEEIIALDLYVLRWWSGVYNGIFALLNRDIDFQSIIDDFGDIIYRELDYVAEAANAQRFTELYSAVTDVFVPKVYSDLTTSKVLTMEWIEGYRLSDPNLESYGLDRRKLVDILIQCSLRQILENGFFHADPHAGNLLACADGRLCYLDFGMMSYAARPQRNGFLLAVVHIVNRDWGELVRLYQKLGFIPQGTDLTPIEVALEKALPDVLNADVSQLNFRNVINALGDIMYTYPFSLPPFYIAIIRCLGVLEGLAIQVDPNSRVIAEAYPYVASRVLTDSQDDLQEALRRLALTSDGNVRWDRLEGLLDRAKDSSGYDVTEALDQLTDYLLSSDGDKLMNELADQIVEGIDDLSSESLQYFWAALRALAISDEVETVRAFRSLQQIASKSSEGVDAVRNEINRDLSEVLPAPTPSMMRFNSILSLLTSSSQGSDDGKDTSRETSKYIPLIRKLAQEPKVQRTANEIIARLSERMLSRGLRLVLNLPPPNFRRP